MINQEANWFVELTSRIQSLAEKFELDDMGVQELRDFVIDIAKSQYRVGNKAGIRWAYAKANGTQATAMQPSAV